MLPVALMNVIETRETCFDGGIGWLITCPFIQLNKIDELKMLWTYRISIFHLFYLLTLMCMQMMTQKSNHWSNIINFILWIIYTATLSVKRKTFKLTPSANNFLKISIFMKMRAGNINCCCVWIRNKPSI